MTDFEITCQRCGKKSLQPGDIHTCTPPKVIAESKGQHWESEDCWCHPRVEHHPHGIVVIHNDPTEC